MEIVTRRFRLRDFIDSDRSSFLAYQADPRNLKFYAPDRAIPEHAAQLFETFQTWAAELPLLNYLKMNKASFLQRFAAWSLDRAILFILYFLGSLVVGLARDRKSVV